MIKPTKIKVEKYGDGWKPLPGQCPWERDKPDDFKPENFSGKNFCMNNQATSACECHLYTASEGICICLYGLTESEKEPYWNRIVEYAERKMPIQGSLFPELETEGEEIPEIPPCPCGSIYFFRKDKGPHKGVYCATCGKWQRWEVKDVEHDPDWVMPFGQHEGWKLSKIPTDYLRGIKDAKGSMKRRFVLELQAREKRFYEAMYDAYRIGCGKSDKADFDTVMVRVATKIGFTEDYVRKIFWLVYDNEFVETDPASSCSKYILCLNENAGLLKIDLTE